jgi:glutathione S-transferase
MLYLYHSTTSVCAIKVRLTLDEKGLAHDGKLLDLRDGEQHEPEYVKLNPNHVVPTLIHDGKVIIESTLIIEYLDEVFADPPLMPSNPYARAIARLWMKKIDDYLHAACSTLTFAIIFPPVFAKITQSERDAYFAAMPNPAYRERQRLSVEQGLDAPHVPTAARGYDKYIGEMETALGTSPYLAGQAYSLADAACVYRISDSAWTQRTNGVSSRPDEGSVQADSLRPGFALQVESKAGSRNPDPAATDQCASPAGIETTAPQQYRSFSVCLALSLVPLRPWRDCDCQAGDHHSLAPRWVSSVLAVAIAQPCWQTEGLG